VLEWEAQDPEKEMDEQRDKSQIGSCSWCEWGEVHSREEKARTIMSVTMDTDEIDHLRL
jgi:hypothetical protein